MADMDDDEIAEKLGDTCGLHGFCWSLLMLSDVMVLTHGIPEAAQHMLRSQL